MEVATGTIAAPPAEGAAADPSPTEPSWPTFESRLVARKLVADRTMSFTFEKPAGWDYRAGQFIDITLLDPPETDAEGNTRGFSLSSAPSEGNALSVLTGACGASALAAGAACEPR